MRRITTIILAVLLSVSCGNAEPQTGPVPSIETLELQRLPGGPPTPNQSFLVKQMQTTMAACLSSLVHDLAGTAEWVPGVWDDPWSVLYHSDGWRVDNQKFAFRRSHGEGHHSLATVEFKSARWDPNRSKIVYGETKVAQDVEVSNDAKTKLIQNASDAVVSVHYDETESLTNSFSSTVTKGLTLDLSASSTTTIGGSYAGVSAEEALTVSMGVETSTEETKEQSEEGTKAASISVEFDAAPRENYLVTITKENATSYQPFTIDGIMDFGIDLYLVTNDSGRRHYPGSTVKLESVDEFEQFVYGLDTEYPELAGYWDTAVSRVKNGVNCVLDSSRRRIQIAGTNQASLDSNAGYRVQSLGNSIPDHLKHLPVEDANDLNDGR